MQRQTRATGVQPTPRKAPTRQRFTPQARTNLVDLAEHALLAGGYQNRLP